MTASPLLVPRLKIGPVPVDPPLLSAPMAGFTNYVFRQLLRQFGGVGLPVTEMVNAKGFLHMSRREESPDRLWGVRDEPRPLAVQIWDNDPETLAAVGVKLIEEFRPDVIDLNFGCPVRQVTQGARSGSYLLVDPPRIGRIVERLVRACEPTPVTAKIRLGYRDDRINAIEVARVIEHSGGAAVTVHGRTAQQMFRGRADWDRIAEIKPHLKTIPLIGNGDVDSPQRVVEIFRRYPVDGVMIGRAAMRRPWIFAQAAAALDGRPIPPEPTLDEQRETMLDHYRRIVQRFGPYRGTILMRKFACCYAHGRPGAKAFRAAAAGAGSPEEFCRAVERFFPRESAEEESTGGRETSKSESPFPFPEDNTRHDR